MSALSNIFGLRNGPSGSQVIRPVERPEISAALRLILAGPRGRADDATLLSFGQYALARRIDLGLAWGAFVGREMVWAVLPMPTPGRTLVLMAPGVPPRPAHAPLAASLVRAVLDEWATRGMVLAQVLVEPQHRATLERLIEGGFEPMAELIYYQRAVHKPPPFELPTGFSLQQFTTQNQSLFEHTILQTYRDSLDCPSLNGRRSIDDVMASHRAGGEFTPDAWHLLIRRETPVGVLLLNGVPGCSGMELVYLGLTPPARGQGLGDLLMRLALHTLGRRGAEFLALAVDARNTPAVKLYQRHGLRRQYVRSALIADLDRPRLVPASLKI